MKKIKYFSFDKNLNLRQVSHLFAKKKEKKNDFDVVKYFNIGYYLLTPLILGVFLGYYLDQRLKVHYLTVCGILLGSIGTFYNLIRLVK